MVRVESARLTEDGEQVIVHLISYDEDNFLAVERHANVFRDVKVLRGHAPETMVGKALPGNIWYRTTYEETPTTFLNLVRRRLDGDKLKLTKVLNQNGEFVGWLTKYRNYDEMGERPDEHLGANFIKESVVMPIPEWETLLNLEYRLADAKAEEAEA